MLEEYYKNSQNLSKTVKNHLKNFSHMTNIFASSSRPPCFYLSQGEGSFPLDLIQTIWRKNSDWLSLSHMSTLEPIILAKDVELCPGLDHMFPPLDSAFIRRRERVNVMSSKEKQLLLVWYNSGCYILLGIESGSSPETYLSLNLHSCACEPICKQGFLKLLILIKLWPN